MGDEPLPLETRAQLDEAFSESDLPWKVDVLDWAQTEQGFQEAIKENSLSLTKTHSTLIRHASNCMNTQSQHLSPYKLQLASLGELADNATGSIAIGPFGSRMKADCYVSSGMPVIRGTNLVHGRKWAGDWVYVPLELADTMPNCQVNAGDIVFPHRGAIGEVGIVPDDGKTYLISSSLMKIKLDRTKSEPDFIYYYFSSQAGREEILKFSSSVGTPGIGQPLTSMRQFKIPRFPLQVQKSIASILGSLDDKIDLNRRTNETLEAMARALFRDWFVDFGPTRAKMAGEASYLAPELWELFPDRLDDEGKPEGWEVCNFDELVNINPKEKLSKNTIAPYLSMSELPTQGCLAEAPISRPFSGGSKFRNGDTLFARITPCLENGKTALAQNLENNIVGWGSTEFHILRGKGNVPFSWVYLMARDNEFRTNAIRGMTGTSGRQRVASEVLATYKTVTPSGNQIWKAFDRACNPLFEKIIINGAESRTLAQLRDLLLPKLMTGEISIRDAEKMVEDAA